MASGTIQEKIENILRGQLGLKVGDEIKMDDTIGGTLGADSLDKVELVMAIEEEFGIEVPDEEAEKVTTVGDMMDLVSKHLQA